MKTIHAQPAVNSISPVPMAETSNQVSGFSLTSSISSKSSSRPVATGGFNSDSADIRSSVGALAGWAAG